MTERSTICAIPRDNLVTIQKGTMRYRWRDVLCNKNPFDFALYPVLLWREKPKTIVEVGTKEGGSALWLWELCHLFGFDTNIVSIDIDQRAQYTHPGISFYQADGRNLRSTLNGEALDKIGHPLLVIEDADHHARTTAGVLEFFDPLLHVGEYILVEDGICDSFGTQDLRGEGGPTRAIHDFLAANPGRYEIDTSYCDYFGYNVTWNPNGYLRKIA